MGRVPVVVITVALIAVLGYVLMVNDSDGDPGNHYFYDQLTDDEKSIYDALRSVNEQALNSPLHTFEVTAKFPDPDYHTKESYMRDQVESQLSNAIMALKMEDPLAICTWGNSKIAVDYTKSVSTDHNSTGAVLYCINTMHIVVIIDPSYSDVAKAYKDLKAASDSYKVTVKDKRDASYYINNHIIDICHYSETSKYQYDAYGALVDRSGVVCEGYCKGFQLLCQANGIECYTVYGYSVSELDATHDYSKSTHSWNFVRIDGRFYVVDVTWNDTSNSDDFFFCNVSKYFSTHIPGYNGMDFQYPYPEDTYEANSSQHQTIDYIITSFPSYCTIERRGCIHFIII